MVIGEADVDNVDTAWTTRVLRRHHSVEYSAQLMCGSGSRVMQRQSRTVDQRVKLNGVRIVRTVEANVEVAGDVDGCRVGGELLENSTKFVEVRLLNRRRSGSIDDGDNGSELSSDSMKADQLER